MNRLGTVSSVLIVTAAMLGISWSSARGQPGQGGRRGPMMQCEDNFNAMDTNKDGVVTKEEFMAAKHPGGHGEEVFVSKDVNGDGKLTKEEFCSRKGPGKGRGKGAMQQ